MGCGQSKAALDAAVTPNGSNGSHKTALPRTGSGGESNSDKLRYEADVAQAIRAATVVREQEAQKLRGQAQALEAHAGGGARRQSGGAGILQGGGGGRRTSVHST